jgi:hypothetical protein
MTERRAGTAATEGTERRSIVHENGGVPIIPPEPSKTTSRARPSNMKKRVLPDLVKFDTPGITCNGVLVRMNMKKGDTKNYMEYILHNVAEDKIYRFNGSYEIDNQIFRTDLHKFIEVTFVGEDRNIIRNGNALKKFEVWVDEGKPGSAGAPAAEWQASDEDIPF